MRRGVAAGLALGILFLGGCGKQGDSFDSLVRGKIKLIDEKARILERIKDRRTAEQARPELEDVNKRIKENDERRGRLARDKNPDAMFTQALKAEMDNAPELTRAGRRLGAAREKVLANAEAAKVLEGVNLE